MVIKWFLHFPPEWYTYNNKMKRSSVARQIPFSYRCTAVASAISINSTAPLKAEKYRQQQPQQSYVVRQVLIFLHSTNIYKVFIFYLPTHRPPPPPWQKMKNVGRSVGRSSPSPPGRVFPSPSQSIHQYRKPGITVLNISNIISNIISNNMSNIASINVLNIIPGIE